MLTPTPYGCILRAWRRQAGLSQQALAYRLSIKQSTISGWETASNPGMAILRRWAEITGLPLAEIVALGETHQDAPGCAPAERPAGIRP